MTRGGRGDDVATALAHMARDLLEQDSVQAILDQIAQYAVRLVDGCEAAGILVVEKGRVETVAATDNVVRAADRLQGELGEGPCFDAATRKHQVYRIGDLGSGADQWPRFAPQAYQLGVGSMMGFLLYTHGRNDLGALNLYSSRPAAFTVGSEHAGWVLASHCAVALAGARRHDNMQLALASSRAISEAIGIVMARYALTEPEAFDKIVAVSQRRNTKVRDLAETINHTGDLPAST